ncbi:hypothetical protein [Pantanalinema sp. GBBB05]|uniref:hypothetical protein n=1 Tax=Pantanalinema sp. GBBB05 TaxID=2604139 RepID=UPI001DB5DA4F|nr:response regulator [Pantanalinema sp. GBBB05]
MTLKDESKLNNAIPRFERKIILLVEIQAATIEAVEQYLHVTGALVETVDSLAAAGERLAFFTPNIIMTNLQLFQESRLTLLTQVKVYERKFNRAQIPIVAIADYSNEEGEIALDTGFQAYIRPPIEAASLYAAISQFI